MKSAISSALPKHMSPDRLVRTVLTALQITPGLSECSKDSVLLCAMQSAALGLEPGPLGHCYYIPFGGTATFIPSYKGLIELARRSGKLKEIYAVVVYENEPFEITLGLDRNLKHKPKAPDERGEKWIGAYAVAKLSDGAVEFEFMWPQDIEHVRSKSKAKEKASGPWTTDPEEMIKKTVLKRLCKRLPMSAEMADAIAEDDTPREMKNITATVSGVELPPEVRVELEHKEKGFSTAEVREILSMNANLAEAFKKSGLKPTDLPAIFTELEGDIEAITKKLEGMNEAN